MEGMDGSYQDRMRSSPERENISSSSLEVKRPVRSFKSFIKTVPPHPESSEKPLLPAFSPAPSLTMSTQTSTQVSPGAVSLNRNPSVGSWNAPTDWYGTADAPQIALNRSYSPIIPEPSPDISDVTIQSKFSPVSPLQIASARLKPIYERKNSHDLAPPSSPPQSPLPAPPVWTLNGKKKESPLLSKMSHVSNSSSVPTVSKSLYDSDLQFRTASSPSSTQTSIVSTASTKEKAFASLGIESPTQQTAMLNSPSYKPAPSKPSGPIQADGRYLRGKKLKSVNKGNPLTDDSWEDPEMDDKTRLLSFSQDYHDLLANQYRDTDEEEPEPKPDVPPKDHELVPPPLSWRKSTSGGPSPNTGSPRTQSRADSHEISSVSGAKKSQHKRIPSWVPRRLSIGSSHKPVPGEQNTPTDNHGTAAPKRSKKIPNAEADKEHKHDLRLSMFFPASKVLGLGKKSKDHNAKTSPATKNAALAASPAQASPKTKTTPVLRLPGGLAIVRNSPSVTTQPSPAWSNDAHPQSRRGSSYHASPISPSNNNHRHSLPAISPTSPMRANANSLGFNFPIQNNSTSFRHSGSSFNSQTSSTSRPLANAISAPFAIRPPPPPPPPPPIPYEAPLSAEAWERLKTSGAPSSSSSPSRTPHHLHFLHPSFSSSPSSSLQSYYTQHRDDLIPSFVTKARDARRRHNAKQRQEKLKKSIKLLGPTDPSVVSGYVKDSAGSSGEFGRDGWADWDVGTGVGTDETGRSGRSGRGDTTDEEVEGAGDESSVYSDGEGNSVGGMGMPGYLTDGGVPGSEWRAA